MTSRTLLAASLAWCLLVPATATGTGDQTPPRTTHTVTSSPGKAVVVLRATDNGLAVLRTQYRIDGGRWLTYAATSVALLDRTLASYHRWRHIGPGEVVRLADGSVETRGGPLGVLWYPDQVLRDVAVTMQWRDAKTDGCCSNAGVFVRFPDPERAVAVPRTTVLACQQSPALVLAEWVPISCGQEVQINDGTEDPQATGSIYNFKSLARDQARVTPQGTWNDYEIRLTGGGSYTVVVLRRGRVINAFRNSPGQSAARDGDPPTDARQFAAGYLGLQNHLDGDVVQFRNIRVRDLSPEAAAITVTVPGRHVVEYRSTDLAGNVERIRRVTVQVTRR